MPCLYPGAMGASVPEGPPALRQGSARLPHVVYGHVDLVIQDHDERVRRRRRGSTEIDGFVLPCRKA